MEDEKVKQLADTLKNQGLAASMFEAIEKAKSILNVKTPKSNEQQKKEDGNYDITKEDATLNELMQELGVTPEQIEAQEQEKVEEQAASKQAEIQEQETSEIQQQEKIDEVKEEIEDIKEEIKQAEENPEKIEQIKEDIEKVKDEVNELVEHKAEETQESKPEKDMFEEEKKIDLTKVFSQKK